MSAETVSALLYFEYRSESLRCRIWLDPVEGVPLVRRWADDVLTITAVSRVHVVCHSLQDEATLNTALHGLPATVYRSRCHSQLHALTEWAAQTKERRVAIWPLAFSFAPEGLMEQMLAHHAAKGNRITEVSGLPDGTMPLIADASLLVDLGSLAVPGMPATVSLAARRLAQLERQTGQELPFALACVPFDARSAYDADPKALPRAVRLEDSRDIEVARRVCERLRAEPAGDCPFRALQLWKEENYRATCQRRAELKALAFGPAAPACAEPRRRVLFVSNPSAYSGAEESLCQMVGHLDPARFDKHALLALDGFFAERLRASGARVICRGSGFGQNTVDNYLYTYGMLRDIRPDVVHLNSIDGIPVLCAATHLDVPIVQHVRNGRMDPYPEYLQAAGKIIVVSDFLRREVLRFGIPEDRIHLIYDEADCEFFKRACFNKKEIRRDLGLDANARVLLMIARFAPNKRHDLLLSAIPLVRQCVPSLRVILRGDVCEADYFEFVQTRIDTLRLGQAVIISPFVQDIRHLHVAADALVLCSDREGLGRCVVEAMAMETPVVVTDSGGSHEIVAHRQSGFVARAGDPEELARCIVEAICDEDLRREVTRNARRFVELNLSAKASAQRVMEIYDSLVA